MGGVGVEGDQECPYTDLSTLDEGYMKGKGRKTGEVKEFPFIL